MPGHTFPPETVRAIRLTLWRFGVHSQVTDRCLAKYAAGALPEPCVSELKGKGAGLEDGCRCDGCTERDTLAFLALVQRQLQQPRIG